MPPSESLTLFILLLSHATARRRLSPPRCEAPARLTESRSLILLRSEQGSQPYSRIQRPGEVRSLCEPVVGRPTTQDHTRHLGRGLGVWTSGANSHASLQSFRAIRPITAPQPEKTHTQRLRVHGARIDGPSSPIGCPLHLPTCLCVLFSSLPTYRLSSIPLACSAAGLQLADNLAMGLRFALRRSAAVPETSRSDSKSRRSTSSVPTDYLLLSGLAQHPADGFGC